MTSIITAKIAGTAKAKATVEDTMANKQEKL